MGYARYEGLRGHVSVGEKGWPSWFAMVLVWNQELPVLLEMRLMLEKRRIRKEKS